MAQVGDLPEQFGRYRIIKRLGQGGMGSVYLAEDSQLGRKVALKVALLASANEQERIARFRREARAAASLKKHPNLCTIYDFGEIDGIQFLTMDFIEGESLAARLKSLRTFPEREAAAISSKLAKALSVAHAKGVIHRDLKPLNIMMERVDTRFEPVIVDFGLARLDDPNEQQLSLTGEAFGTLHYMAPERFRGESAPSCDIYALGVIFYELLTGQTPFDGPNHLVIMAQIVTQEAACLSTIRPDLDPRFETCCMRAMAKDIANRYRSMEEFAKELDTVLDAPSSAKPTFQSMDFSDITVPTWESGTSLIDPLSVEKSPLKIWISPSTGMEFVLIPEGEFDMGSAEDDYEAESDEKPLHYVRITKPFFLGKFEVTRGQFRKFIGAGGYKTEAEQKGESNTWLSPGFKQTDDHPVVYVSWNDAVKFAEWLSKKDGRTYRLPTEAEWEYACRAGSTTRFSFGDDPNQLAQSGNSSGRADGFEYTAPVGSFKPNAWGLYDMHGNVWEWCSDWYGAGYYKNSPTDDPQGAAIASRRVDRGGGWYGGPRNCRSADRLGDTPEYRYGRLGFRLAAVQSE